MLPVLQPLHPTLRVLPRFVRGRAVPVLLILSGLFAAGCTSTATSPASTASATMPSTESESRPASVVEPSTLAEPRGDIRVALFNIRELSLETLRAAADGEPGEALAQVRAAAAIVQRVRPDVLVVQEIDYPSEGNQRPTAVARIFAEGFLARPQPAGGAALDYPHLYAAPVNTGILSGLDLNGDGTVATAVDRGDRAHGDDSLGWGTYPGQYGMAVLSRFPLQGAAARTFQHFLWRDLPGHHLPPGYYSAAALEVLPLSSKSHWDLPVRVPGAAAPLHLWISHPTPPVFDGDEDRNGRRNFDELRFWKLYADGAPGLVDDAGREGGFSGRAPFLVVGDLNADPQNRDVVYDGVTAAGQLLDHPQMVDAGQWLVSPGGAVLERVGGSHPERSTAAFDSAMRLDHLIPGGGARPLAGGVYWPAVDQDPEGAALAAAASDHRLVWLDLELP